MSSRCLTNQAARHGSGSAWLVATTRGLSPFLIRHAQNVLDNGYGDFENPMVWEFKSKKFYLQNQTPLLTVVDSSRRALCVRHHTRSCATRPTWRRLVFPVANVGT